MLSDDVLTAAQLLGRALRADRKMRSYYATVDQLNANDEARELDQRLSRLTDSLCARQQAGEIILKEEMDELYSLRYLARANELISERNAALQMVKPFLTVVADEIGWALDVDYVDLAKPKR